MERLIRITNQHNPATAKTLTIPNWPLKFMKKAAIRNVFAKAIIKLTGVDHHPAVMAVEPAATASRQSNAT
jgi:hypothetical protein